MLQQSNGLFSVVIENEDIEAGSYRDQIIRRAPNSQYYSSDQIFSILYDIVNLLTKASKGKIYHQGIKPHNLLVDPRGKPKLCDFGESIRCPDQTDSKLTGAPNFMSYSLYSEYKAWRSTGRFTNNFSHEPEKSDVMSLSITIIAI